MAIIQINNAVVKKVYSSSFVVGEVIKVPGYGEFEKTYTVWSKNSFPVGSIVDVSGRLSMKAKVYEGKTLIDISINDPEIKAITIAEEKTEVESIIDAVLG